MISDGYRIGDGSWELKILVTDLKVERTLRVKGDLHIGGVMLKLVEELDVAIDWSDHALWWPEKNMWLLRTRTTLDQYGVGADALLNFTPMHKVLRIQLPDLRFIDSRVDFAVPVFRAVNQLCKELNIRHPEELSFTRPLTSEHLKKNYKHAGVTRKQRPKDSFGPITQTNGSLNNSPNTTFNDTSGVGDVSFNGSGYMSGNVTSESLTGQSEKDPYLSLANSPTTPSSKGRANLIYPKSLIEKARMNCGWLDSSLSLYEQNVQEFDLLLLKYKFFSFYDLNPKMDANRINMIYEQARWSLLSEEVDCTEEEMMMFAALTLQVQLQMNNSFTSGDDFDMSANSEIIGNFGTTGRGNRSAMVNETVDDIDNALDDLQLQLEGVSVMNSSAPRANSPSPNLTDVPVLSDYLRVMKPRKFTLKTFKRLYCVFKDTRLTMYKSAEESRNSSPAVVLNLKGSEVTPDVNLSQSKYGIKLEIPTGSGVGNVSSSSLSDTMSEYWIRFTSEEQYAKWLAGFYLAAKGKTMADSSYESDVKEILDLLSLQHPALAPAISPNSVDINAEDYVSPKYMKKAKSKSSLTQRILEAHANVKHLSYTSAKLNYIKAWQALPDFGISMFVVKFAGIKKEELLGIASNRLMRMDLSGDHLKTWRYNTMKAWNVNWEIKQVNVNFEEENVQFACLSADCKVIHEFIGGYIFLSMRSKESNQTLNEELFFKLTGGWI